MTQSAIKEQPDVAAEQSSLEGLGVPRGIAVHDLFLAGPESGRANGRNLFVHGARA